MHLVVAETDAEALPRRNRPGRSTAGTWRRPAASKPRSAGSRSSSVPTWDDARLRAPAREVRRDLDAAIERSEEQARRDEPRWDRSLVVAGPPAAVRDYMDEYGETGANYFVCSFQWGDLTTRRPCGPSSFSPPRSCHIMCEALSRFQPPRPVAPGGEAVWQAGRSDS